MKTGEPSQRPTVVQGRERPTPSLIPESDYIYRDGKLVFPSSYPDSREEILMIATWLSNRMALDLREIDDSSHSLLKTLSTLSTGFQEVFRHLHVMDPSLASEFNRVWRLDMELLYRLIESIDVQNRDDEACLEDEKLKLVKLKVGHLEESKYISRKFIAYLEGMSLERL